MQISMYVAGSQDPYMQIISGGAGLAGWLSARGPDEETNCIEGRNYTLHDTSPPLIVPY